MADVRDPYQRGEKERLIELADKNFTCMERLYGRGSIYFC